MIKYKIIIDNMLYYFSLIAKFMNKYSILQYLKIKNIKPYKTHEQIKNEHIYDKHMYDEHLYDGNMYDEYLYNEHIYDEYTYDKHINNEHINDEHINDEHINNEVSININNYRNDLNVSSMIYRVEDLKYLNDDEPITF